MHDKEGKKEDRREARKKAYKEKFPHSVFLISETLVGTLGAAFVILIIVKGFACMLFSSIGCGHFEPATSPLKQCYCTS